MPFDFSMFNILNIDSGKSSWNEDIMKSINKDFFSDDILIGDLLHVRLKNKNQKVRKISVDKVINDKLKLIVHYEEKGSKKLKKKNLFYSIETDDNLSKHVKNLLVKTIKDNFISFEVKKDN